MILLHTLRRFEAIEGNMGLVSTNNNQYNNLYFMYKSQQNINFLLGTNNFI